MKKALDWKAVGQFFSVLLNLFTVIRDTFTKQGIGLDIIGWVTGEGKKVFVEEFLKPLGEKFLALERVVVVDQNTIRVNLDAPPKLPFDGAQVDSNQGGGWVTVQKRSDGLYVDDRKVVLHLSERQQDGKVIRGHELRDELSGKPVLHPNILDALLEHTHLIPLEWKGQLVLFWAVIYRSSDGSLGVRCLGWSGGRWRWDYFWLDDGFRGLDPAALLAS